jgi:hypothetical protein
MENLVVKIPENRLSPHKRINGNGEDMMILNAILSLATLAYKILSLKSHSKPRLHKNFLRNIFHSEIFPLSEAVLNEKAGLCKDK